MAADTAADTAADMAADMAAVAGTADAMRAGRPANITPPAGGMRFSANLAIILPHHGPVRT
jgi:hypothetical protein